MRPLSSSMIPAAYNRQSWWQIIHRIIQPLTQLVDGYLFKIADGAPITADYTAPLGVSFIPVDASSGAVTVTLPAVDESSGRRITVKKIDNSANTVTVDGNGSETIDDATTQIITTQYDSICVMSDLSEWWIV